MKTVKVFYYIGTALSLLIGIWHFFVPWMFGWHSYIPSQYKNLIVSIDWVNLCFSLLLSGLSLLLILWGKKVFSGNAEAITLFGFLTFVWIFRVFIAIVIPVPLEPIAAVAYGQFAGSVIIATLMSVSLFNAVRLYKAKK
jgi:magnesium-transporting ATPase (P-type)